MKETNDLQTQSTTNPRPSKSGVACSNHAESARNKGVNADVVTPPLPETQGREALNAGKTLADTTAQVARLRAMAEQKRVEAQEWLEQSISQRPCSGATHDDCRRHMLRCEENMKDFSAAADALEREAWCEDHKVDVRCTEIGDWMCSVPYCEDVHRQWYAPTRNAAIDAARRGGE